MTEAAPHSLLIIDDNPNNLKVVLRHFEEYDFELYTALDGKIGLRRARLAQPDLILLDIQMPGIDGYETCRRLKSNPQTAHIPVIFMTALTESEDKVRAFEVGGVDYVTKPIEVNELMSRVRAHLQIRALRDDLERHNNQLEGRVAERTAELERELAQRAAYQAEREHLLGLVRMQSEQLRSLTQRWIQSQTIRDMGLAESLQEQVSDRLDVLKMHLEQASRLTDRLDSAGSDRDREQLRGHLESARSLIEPTRQQAAAVRQDLSRPVRDERADALLSLSEREYEVLQMTAEGKSNKEIAYTLDIARSTVSTYRNRIMEKLGVEDVPGLVRLAVRYEVIS